MKELELAPLEQRILRQSSDLAVTRRRRSGVMVFGAVFALMLAGFAWLKPASPVIPAVALIYIAITVFEKVAYSNALLGYKSLIQKLTARIEELEGR